MAVGDARAPVRVVGVRWLASGGGIARVAVVTDDEVTGSATQAARPRPVAAMAQTSSRLSDSDASRGRAIAGFGVLLGVFGAFAGIAVDGDPLARSILLIGMLAIGVTNTIVFLTIRRLMRFGLPLPIMWNVSMLGVLAALPFSGVFSGVLAALILVVHLCSLGQSRGAAIAAYAIAALGHAMLTALIGAGVVEDRGVMPVPDVGAVGLVVLEVTLQMGLAVAFAIGRWSRRTTQRAFAELERAARASGQREALDEARDLARALRAGKLGRHSERSFGRYVVGEVIGRGAMGEVYEARPSGDGKPVAIKILHDGIAADPQRLIRFHREAAALGAIESRHVVKVFEIGSEPAPYIVMERLHGSDLAEVLRERPTLETPEVLRLVEDLAHGLDEVRRRGIVHRDLKPQNAFRLAATGRWKILDFGVVAFAGSSGTLTGDRIVGTPAYMAPEQVIGGPIEHTTDVYGLAAIAYRCLTGRPPFGGVDINQLLYKVAHERPARPSLFAPLSRRIDAVLALGLARRAADRFPTAIAFSEAIAAAVLSGEAPPEPSDAWAR
jgi:predicted Ser/Thr protein kinase